MRRLAKYGGVRERPHFIVDRETWRVTCPDVAFSQQSVDEAHEIVRSYLRRQMTERNRACLERELQQWLAQKIYIQQIQYDLLGDRWVDSNLDSVTSFGVPYGRCSGDLP